MDLKRRIARLRAADGHGDPAPEAPRSERDASPRPRRSRSAAARSTHDDAHDDAHDDELGGARVTSFAREDLHGAVPLGAALEVSSASVARLALDPSLAGVDLRTALFLDTETTGLAGGAGTIPFLVGVASFEGDRLLVTQHLVPEPGLETPMLTWLAARIAACSCIVSFNGKSFDLPLLRTRYAMSLLPAPPERPHLDLLHLARRIYRARIERCQLTALERDVLGFARSDDVSGEDVPEIYQRFLREGRVALLDPVLRHNVWDLLALVALVAELSARGDGVAAEGRFEPEDLLGVARTTWRAGDHARALAFADALAAHAPFARDAHLLAAAAHRAQRDPRARVARLREALSLCPDDPQLHLDLARCYERELDDPAAALEHALCAQGAEPPAALGRRVARLRRRARARAAEAAQLRLPGVM